MFGLLKLPSMIDKLQSRGYRIEIVIDKRYFLSIYEPSETAKCVILLKVSGDTLQEVIDKIPMKDFEL